MKLETRYALEAIASTHKVQLRDMIGHCRAPALVEARVEMYRWLRARGLSLKQIGTICHRDHSSVCYLLNDSGLRTRRKQRIAKVWADQFEGAI